MSPYLFVLIMDVLTLLLRQIIDQDGGFFYHWKCEEMQLCQLGFTDDLLLFSKADTSSVHIFKRALAVFADLSGLRANLHKSHLILSHSAGPLRDTLLAILDFQEGHLPLWVQLIKSVLSALQVYWAMAFILPNHVIKGIEQRLRKFLWKGNTDVGYAKVSWQQLTAPPFGWIGFSIIGFGIAQFGRSVIGLDHGVAEIGPLILQFPLGPQHTSIPDSALLCTVIMGGDWNWPPITNMESIGITHSLPPIHGGNDRIQWMGPRVSFSSAAVYDVFCPPGPKDALPETHEYLFFACSFAADCLREIRGMVSFHCLTLLGQWSFSGPRLDGGKSTSSTLHLKRYWLHWFIIYGKNGIDVSSNTLRYRLLILLGLLFLRLGI
ncbi:UNVERIFIED_CONTAM: hypothetical protein Slati_2213400 [Sesamum latifolium]|uniref:Reverse transcriptase domain-containing protein n=1 Tax=Sesamum latifolium TaxID=2727402 RepID=A0AAW2WT56_9LAMI